MDATKSLNATITLASETGFVDPTWAATGGPGGARLPALPGLPASVPKQTIAAGNQRNKRMHMYKQKCMDAQACGAGPRTKSRKEVECWKRRNREGNPKPRILPCRESSLRVVPAARVQLAWTGLGFMAFYGVWRIPYARAAYAWAVAWESGLLACYRHALLSGLPRPEL